MDTPDKPSDEKKGITPVKADEEKNDSLGVKSPPSKNDYILRKHKSIVHRTHFPTVIEEKIFNAFLLAAKVAFKTEKVDKCIKEGFFTTEKYINNFSGIKIKDPDYVRGRIRLLQTTLITFDYFDESEVFNKIRTFSPISEARYEGNGVINFFLPPTLIEVISNPEAFADIDTQITSRFTCVYSIAIYEMGVTHLDSSMVFSLADFRDYMGLKPEEYTSSSDLRRYVIEKGCSEVNLKSTIYVQYSLIKEGRGNKLTGVKFEFSERQEPLEIPSGEGQLELVAKYCSLLPFSLSGETYVISILTKKLDEFGEEWVQSNVEAFLARINAPGQPPVNKPGALFRSTFKHDYGAEVRNAKKVAEIMAKMEKQRTFVFVRSEAEKKQQETEQTALEIEGIRARETKYVNYYEAMGIEEQKSVLAGIEKVPGLFGSKGFKLTHYLSEVLGINL